MCGWRSSGKDQLISDLCLQVETLTEIASIIKRLAGDESGLAALVGCNVHETLTQLLNSNGAKGWVVQGGVEKNEILKIASSSCK